MINENTDGKTVTMSMAEYYELKAAYMENYAKAVKEKEETEENLKKGLMKIVEIRYSFGFQYTEISSWSDGAEEFKKLDGKRQYEKNRADKFWEQLREINRMSLFELIKWKLKKAN